LITIGLPWHMDRPTAPRAIPPSGRGESLYPQ
jgi:hypothetical protein